MTLKLTQAASLRAGAGVKKPLIIFEIDEFDRIFSVDTVMRTIKVGETGFVIGTAWKIGGLTEEEAQDAFVSLSGGTSTSIQQQLDPDLGSVSSVSSFTVRLIDKDESVTELITPGAVLADVLGRRGRILLGFEGTAYPEDYVEVHAGDISDLASGAGYVDFVISHPEDKKRQDIFVNLDTKLGTSINNSVTTIVLDGSTDMSTVLRPIAKPGGGFDASILFYVKIGDEIIRYTGVSGFSLTGCTRAQLGTSAASATAGDEVSSVIALTGTAMELALKILLSGVNGPSITDVPVSSFLYDIPETVNIADPRVVFFQGIDLPAEIGLVAGDFITTAGAVDGANDFSEQEIEDVVVRDNGTYLLLTSQFVTLELSSTATAAFRSQYDSLGYGLAMNISEVDVPKHEEIQVRYLPTLQYQFFLKDKITGQDFLANEIYRPAACYSLPRSGKVSVGITAPPLPGGIVPVLDKRNIINPSEVILKRSTSRNFQNTLIYSFDEDLASGDFKTTITKQDATSLARIPVGTKALTIESRGMRTSLAASSAITTAAARRLARYRFGAEFIEDVKIFFGDAFQIEVGDIVLLDPTDLKISDTEAGTRKKTPKFWEVVNKKQPFSADFGQVSLLDTNFSTQNRYGLISPASLVKESVSSTKIAIKPSFSQKFGENEWRKWKTLEGKDVMITIRNPSGSSTTNAILVSVGGNVMTFDRALGYTPAENDVVQLAAYTVQSDFAKAYYGFMRDSAFGDGKPQYRMV